VADRSLPNVASVMRNKNLQSHAEPSHPEEIVWHMAVGSGAQAPEAWIALTEPAPPGTST
jgi:hypothetical protein